VVVQAAQWTAGWTLRPRPPPRTERGHGPDSGLMIQFASRLLSSPPFAGIESHARTKRFLAAALPRDGEESEQQASIRLNAANPFRAAPWLAGRRGLT
jgi:hypothetical protein